MGMTVRRESSKDITSPARQQRSVVKNIIQVFGILIVKVEENHLS